MRTQCGMKNANSSIDDQTKIRDEKGRFIKGHPVLSTPPTEQLHKPEVVEKARATRLSRYYTCPYCGKVYRDGGIGGHISRAHNYTPELKAKMSTSLKAAYRTDKGKHNRHKSRERFITHVLRAGKHRDGHKPGWVPPEGLVKSKTRSSKKLQREPRDT